MRKGDSEGVVRDLIADLEDWYECTRDGRSCFMKIYRTRVIDPI